MKGVGGRVGLKQEFYVFLKTYDCVHSISSIDAWLS